MGCDRIDRGWVGVHPFAFACSLPLKVVGGVLQLLGIVLAALGVGVVRSCLKRLAETANEAKRKLERNVVGAADKAHRALGDLLDAIGQRVQWLRDLMAGDSSDDDSRQAQFRHPLRDDELLSTDETVEAHRIRIGALEHEVAILTESLTIIRNALAAQRDEWQQQLAAQRDAGQQQLAVLPTDLLNGRSERRI